MGVFGKDPISRVINLLAATRVHRIFVTNDEAKYQPVAVISITDVLVYLLKSH